MSARRVFVIVAGLEQLPRLEPTVLQDLDRALAQLAEKARDSLQGPIASELERARFRLAPFHVTPPAPR